MSLGIEASTSSERRIASLAQQRERQARDIAEALFLTKNTVVRHLHHISRKLDIASRAALKAEFEAKRPAGVGATPLAWPSPVDRLERRPLLAVVSGDHQGVGAPIAKTLDLA